jgi:DNA-binding Xre family transcriptional regulator
MCNIPHNDFIPLYAIIKKKSRGNFMISFAPFRELIKDRGITTYYLRNKCGVYNLDPHTIKRLMTDQSVSTNTINSLCNIFKCELTDIMEFTLDSGNIEADQI